MAEGSQERCTSQDGYGYNGLFDRRDITELACMAHVRRYFEKALDQDKDRAGWMLSKIQLLYKIEAEARDNNFSHEQRYASRQEKSVPVLADIKIWLDENMTEALPKSLVGKAISYMLGRWKALARYLDDGRYEIDNNLVENAIRPVALGRKNYLFAGSHNGAQGAWHRFIHSWPRPRCRALSLWPTLKGLSPSFRTGLLKKSRNFCQYLTHLNKYKLTLFIPKHVLHRTDTPCGLPCICVFLNEPSFCRVYFYYRFFLLR
jgi:Transposase IS66 family